MPLFTALSYLGKKSFPPSSCFSHNTLCCRPSHVLHPWPEFPPPNRLKNLFPLSLLQRYVLTPAFHCEMLTSLSHALRVSFHNQMLIHMLSHALYLHPLPIPCFS